MLPTANPKQGRKPRKIPKWLRRGKKPIKRGKVRFHAHGEYPCNCNRDPVKMALWAQEQAKGRRDNPTDAERAVALILDRLGIRFEREKIWPNGDHPQFSDFWLPDHKITLECDGQKHREDKVYDKRRSLWMARKYSVGTVRFWNHECTSGTAEGRLRQMLGLNVPPNPS